MGKCKERGKFAWKRRKFENFVRDAREKSLKFERERGAHMRCEGIVRKAGKS